MRFTSILPEKEPRVIWNHPRSYDYKIVLHGSLKSNCDHLTFRCWNNQLCFWYLLDTSYCLKIFLFYLWQSHILLCVFKYKTISFHCCCTRRSAFLCCHFIIMTSKIGWKYVSLTGGQTIKNNEENNAWKQCPTFNFFYFSQKKPYLQNYSFIMANLRATNFKKNYKKYIGQIFVKNTQSERKKNKCWEANSLTNLN